MPVALAIAKVSKLTDKKCEDSCVNTPNDVNFQTRSRPACEVKAPGRSNTPQSPAPSATASAVRGGSRVVIIGGGPGGYEAALVGRQLGARVTIIEEKGMGGSAVLTDVVPSKTLIATAAHLTDSERAPELGLYDAAAAGLSDSNSPALALAVDLQTVNERVRRLAQSQSDDIYRNLDRQGVELICGRGKLLPGISENGTRQVAIEETGEVLEAEIVLIATGATPRILPDAQPDGERILTWAQMYNLREIPKHLVVIGSGVTGAEFASAYNTLGANVTLVSSRERVLPHEDEDAAQLIEQVFTRRGMTVLGRSRAEAVTRHGDSVTVRLTDGREITASHCLVAVGAVPATSGIGLEEAGVELSRSGHIEVDGVSRTTAFRVYAAGDCTGVLPLASVAAMQGRIAMWHALGDGVTPLSLSTVAANIFTAPEIATIGVTQAQIDSGQVDARSTLVPLARNPRAKMLGIRDGFVKLFAGNSTDAIIGGVVVAPRACEQILPVTLAVTNRLTADQLSQAFTIYPSISGSITEAARQLHRA